MNATNYKTLMQNSGSGAGAYMGGTGADTLSLAEHHIYASSRLGVQTYEWGATRNIRAASGSLVDSSLNRPLDWYSGAYTDLINKKFKEPWGHTDDSAGLKVSRVVGLRYYELNDHLGNVLATVLDRKSPVVISNVLDRWKADVVGMTDYYPFGMPMPGRSYQASAGPAGKFGFNGQMKTDEIAGKGNHNTTLFWEYDTRVGRRWDIDPILHPWNSSVATFGDNPIAYNDVSGNIYRLHYDPTEKDSKGKDRNAGGSIHFHSIEDLTAAAVTYKNEPFVKAFVEATLNEIKNNADHHVTNSAAIMTSGKLRAIAVQMLG